MQVTERGPMNNSVTFNEQSGGTGWSIRPWLFAGIGLIAGLIAHWISGGLSRDYDAAQGAAVAFVIVSAGLVGFTLERERWLHAVLFSIAFGAIAAGVLYWSSGADGYGPNWHYVSLVAAIVIAAPLFQSARDAGAVRFDYVAVHDHCWTNLVLWCVAWAFVLICILLSHLLAALFSLIKLKFLTELLAQDFYWPILIGGAFGAALGLLREQDRIVRTLQRVVLTILSVLAPVLAVGLVVFIAALPLTGLAPLWEARSAAATLLACVIGAFILINSVIRNSDAEEQRRPVLRFSAMALGIVLTPLAILAAVAIGLRIGQYGYTPDRLWALTFVVLSCVVAIAYLGSLIRGRENWAGYVRAANLRLSVLLCGVALLLATPLLGFNAISTRDQVARLEAGVVSPEKFDWQALAFGFGASGRAALDKLAGSDNPELRERALVALKAEHRHEVKDRMPAPSLAAEDVRVLPEGAVLPAGALEILAGQRCTADGSPCGVVVVDAKTLLLLRDVCFDNGQEELCERRDVLRLRDGAWSVTSNHRPGAQEESGAASAQNNAEVRAQRQAYQSGQVEIRDVTRRQLFVGGKPVGDPFE